MAANSTQQTTPADGTIEEVDGRYVLRFERRFRHPVEKVWDAITRPERITQWFGEGEVDLDLVEGGKFHFRTTGPPELVEAIVAVYRAAVPGILRRWVRDAMQSGRVSKDLHRKLEHTFLVRGGESQRIYNGLPTYWDHNGDHSAAGGPAGHRPERVTLDLRRRLHSHIHHLRPARLNARG